MLTRIITGVSGIALAAFIIMQGGWIYAAFAIILSLLAWHEYAAAFSHAGQSTSYILGFLAVTLFGCCAWFGNSEGLIAGATISVLLVFAEAIFLHDRFAVDQACISIAGIFYVGFCFAHLILLRFLADTVVLTTPVGNMTLGCAFLWIMFLGTWSSDTFAYFIGSFLGKHKLCPTISPKKTIEGFIGGLIGTIVVVTSLGWFLSFPIFLMVALGASIAIVATIGDLAESVIKRYTGVKDSGRIIPGHGGVLDRFDSVMFTAPLVYYFIKFFGLVGV